MHRSRGFRSLNVVKLAGLLIVVCVLGVVYMNINEPVSDRDRRTIEINNKAFDILRKPDNVALAEIENSFKALVQPKKLQSVDTEHKCIARKKPKVWFIRKDSQILRYDRLQHVVTVFKRVGYDIYDPKTDGKEDWDVLWTLGYPFKSSIVATSIWSKLKPHQKINHFPKCGSMTYKVRLATEDYLPQIPKAFKIPEQREDLLAYSKLHPDGLWVQKKDGHRGISIIPVEDMDLKTPGTFVQEYVDKPFLVDGRRFDIGIYVTMTSVNPLRLYVFNEWHMRFCPEPYYPFDPNNTQKYVVTSVDYIAPWDMPSMKKYFRTEGVSRKTSLLSIIREKGFDTEKLEAELMDTIRTVYLTKEPGFISGVREYPSFGQFFEMVRFDFLFDEKLNIYLMEVNMSPNLYPGKYTGHKLMYQQLIYSIVNLVGLAKPIQADVQRSDMEEEDMQVADKDIHAYTDHCVSASCADCKMELCQYCKVCLTVDEGTSLKAAYREHLNRQSFQRLFPRVFSSQMEAESWDYKADDNFTSLNAANQWITLWYRGKCIQEAKWCN